MPVVLRRFVCARQSTSVLTLFRCENRCGIAWNSFASYGRRLSVRSETKAEGSSEQVRLIKGTSSDVPQVLSFQSALAAEVRLLLMGGLDQTFLKASHHDCTSLTVKSHEDFLDSDSRKSLRSGVLRFWSHMMMCHSSPFRSKAMPCNAIISQRRS